MEALLRREMAMRSTATLRNRKLAEVGAEHQTFYLHNREFYFTKQFRYRSKLQTELMPSSPAQNSGVPSRQHVLLTLTSITWYALENGVARSAYFTRQMKRQYKSRSL